VCSNIDGYFDILCCAIYYNNFQYYKDTERISIRRQTNKSCYAIKAKYWDENQTKGGNLNSCLVILIYDKSDIIANYSQLRWIKMTRARRWESIFVVPQGFLDSSATLTCERGMCARPGSSRSSIGDRPRRTCEKAASHVVIPPAILNTGKRRTGDWIAGHGRKEASIRWVIIVLAFLDPALLRHR